MKKFIASVFIISSIFSTIALAEENKSIEIECGVSRCTLKCYIEKDHWETIGKADRITTTTLQSGVTYFNLSSNILGNQTVVVGPDSYLCKISGQK